MTEENKVKRNLFFIEELFEGDYANKAPRTLRDKMQSDDMENIEVNIKCFFGAPEKSKVAFKNYTHFRKTTTEMGINLTKYFK